MNIKEWLIIEKNMNNALSFMSKYLEGVTPTMLKKGHRFIKGLYSTLYDGQIADECDSVESAEFSNKETENVLTKPQEPFPWGRRKYTEKEREALLSSIVVLVDTREHAGKNTHILSWLDANCIPWKKCKLDYGDYSFMVPANEDVGLLHDAYFDKEIMVERKANLEEMSGNLSKERERIKTEFAYSPKNKVLLIEDASYSIMEQGRYNTNFQPKSFRGSLFSMWHKYNIPFVFMKDKERSGSFIYHYFYYYLMMKLK